MDKILRNQDKQKEVEKTPKRINAKDLFGEEKLVFIQHGQTLYRLMITRQDKLILTK